MESRRSKLEAAKKTDPSYKPSSAKRKNKAVDDFKCKLRMRPEHVIPDVDLAKTSESVGSTPYNVTKKTGEQFSHYLLKRTSSCVSASTSYDVRRKLETECKTLDKIWPDTTVSFPPYSMRYCDTDEAVWLRLSDDRSGLLCTIRLDTENYPGYPTTSMQGACTKPPLNMIVKGFALAIDSKRGYVVTSKRDAIQLLTKGDSQNQAREVMAINACPASDKSSNITSISYDVSRDVYVIGDELLNMYVMDAETHDVIYKCENTICKPWVMHCRDKLTYMLDANKCCVYEFNANLKLLNQNSPYQPQISDKSIGRMNKPSGLCVDYHGNVIICDTGNHRLLRLKPDGETGLWEMLCDFGDKTPKLVEVNKRREMFVVFGHDPRGRDHGMREFRCYRYPPAPEEW